MCITQKEIGHFACLWSPCVQCHPLIESKKISLPPLHIKLGLMNFVKAMDTSKAVFQFFMDKFPSLSEGKIREGVFVGPQIREFSRC